MIVPQRLHRIRPSETTRFALAGAAIALSSVGLGVAVGVGEHTGQRSTATHASPLCATSHYAASRRAADLIHRARSRS